MTIITSGDISIVDTFYAVCDASGFWRYVETTDYWRMMKHTGDPLLAMPFDSAEDALECLKEESGVADGKANVVKIEVTTKIEDVK